MLHDARVRVSPRLEVLMLRADLDESSASSPQRPRPHEQCWKRCGDKCDSKNNKSSPKVRSAERRDHENSQCAEWHEPEEHHTGPDVCRNRCGRDACWNSVPSGSCTAAIGARSAISRLHPGHRQHHAESRRCERVRDGVHRQVVARRVAARRDEPFTTTPALPFAVTFPATTATLHAKCVVVDDERSFITSANFTDRGQPRNIEAGVVITDGAFSEQLAGQWRLVSAGLIRRYAG